jgi:hypothetical protein
VTGRREVGIWIREEKRVNGERRGSAYLLREHGTEQTGARDAHAGKQPTPSDTAGGKCA